MCGYFCDSGLCILTTTIGPSQAHGLRFTLTSHTRLALKYWASCLYWFNKFSMEENHLPPRGLVTAYGIETAIISSDNGLSPVWHKAIICSNHFWCIVNWTLRNKIQWKCNKNAVTLIGENAFRSVVCKIVTTLVKLQFIKILHVIKIMTREKSSEKLSPVEATSLLCISQQYFWIKMWHKFDDHRQHLQIPLPCMSKWLTWYWDSYWLKMGS